MDWRFSSLFLAKEQCALLNSKIPYYWLEVSQCFGKNRSYHIIGIWWIFPSSVYEYSELCSFSSNFWNKHTYSPQPSHLPPPPVYLSSHVAYVTEFISVVTKTQILWILTSYRNIPGTVPVEQDSYISSWGIVLYSCSWLVTQPACISESGDDDF